MPFSSRIGGFDDESLRSFLVAKQVYSLEAWHFIHEGVPYWSVLISYAYHESVPAPQECTRRDTAEKADWRKRLSDKDWPVFNGLREWRKTRAAEAGVPPYLLFTNEQLTQLVLNKVDSLSALGRIPGVGPSRVENYGKAVLRILHECTGKQEQRASGSAGADGVDGVSDVADANDGKVSEEITVDLDEPD